MNAIKSSIEFTPYATNSIVKGKHCGTFVVLGRKLISDEWFYALKELNPMNYAETAPGEIYLQHDDLTVS